MVYRLFLIISLIFSLSSCGDDVAYRIKGKFSNLDNQTIYAVFENDKENVVDTVVCDKPGVFEIEHKSGDFDRVTLMWENKSYWITAFIEKGEKIEIEGNALYPALLKVKGGKLNNELTKVRQKDSALWREQADIKRSLENTGISSIDKADLMARLANVNLQINESVMEYITKNPDSDAALILIQFLYMNPEHLRYLDKALSLIPTEHRENRIYKELEEYSIRSKRAMPGSTAPNFSVKNIHGEIVSLDSIENKYTMLIFTAPWMDIYLAKQDLLKELANHFPKEQLEVVMISLDNDVKKLRELLEHSNVHWNLVTDSAGQATQLLDLYNISSLPRCFLIDKQHKIQVKTDSGPDMQKELEKFLK